MDFSWGLKNEFKTAVVNEPSVFEPLKFYCKCQQHPVKQYPSVVGYLFIRSSLTYRLMEMEMLMDDLEAADREGSQRVEALSYRPS